MSVQNFTSLGLNEVIGRALEDVGYEQPTPIQSAAIPGLLEGRDLLGVAQTGTGKTAAFALPLLQKLHEQGGRAKAKCPRALILAPTRELAIQIGEEIEGFARYTKLKHAVIFGGVGQNPQVKKLAAGLDILIATPGRLLDLASQRHLDLSAVETLILDEADRLLDMGFIRDVKRIVQQTPKSRQSLLFSATMPKEVAGLAAEILRDPVQVDVSPKERTVRAIEQHVVHLATPNKQRALEMILHDDSCSRAIVFTRTKHAANRVAKKLINAGISAEAIHGNKSQNARQRSLQNFKTGDAWVLVATDIAARGIDIDGVTHVVNFELPHEPESYVHRIGRTGRAGAEGIAWSLVDASERPRLKAIERLAKLEIKVVELDLPYIAPEDMPKESESDRPRRQSSRRSSGGSSGRSSSRSGQGGGRQGGAGGRSSGNSSSGNGNSSNRGSSNGNSAGNSNRGGNSANGSSRGGNSANGNSRGGSSRGGSSAYGNSRGGSSANGNSRGGNSAYGNSRGGNSANGNTANGNTVNGNTFDRNPRHTNAASGNAVNGNTIDGNTSEGPGTKPKRRRRRRPTSAES